METLFQEFIKANNYINKMFGYPTFTWNGETYQGIPNSYVVKIPLDTGGFRQDLNLELTVSRYTKYNLPIFPNDIAPQAQQTLIYSGQTFRIESVSNLPVINSYEGQSTTQNGATIKIHATCEFRGI